MEAIQSQPEIKGRKRFNTHLPDDLFAWLKERAKRNERSMNAEAIIIFRGFQKSETQ